LNLGKPPFALSGFLLRALAMANCLFDIVRGFAATILPRPTDGQVMKAALGKLLSKGQQASDPATISYSQPYRAALSQ
jgi:hypothetical protein